MKDFKNFVINLRWNLGAIFCDLWTLSDTLLCTASILNLCAISVDRYCIILHAMVYTQRRNAKLMYLMILFVWLLSALISIPPLLGWGKPSARLEKDQLCAYSSDLKYQIYATLLAFYLPSIVMIIIYITIYRAAKKIRKRELETSGGLKYYNANQKPSLSSCPDYQLNNKSQLEPLLGNNNNNDNSNQKIIKSENYSPNQLNIYDNKNTHKEKDKNYQVNNNKHRSNKNKLSKHFNSLLKDNQQNIFVQLKRPGLELENGSVESKVFSSSTQDKENNSHINIIDYNSNVNAATNPAIMVVTSTNQTGINSSNLTLAINPNSNKQTSHSSKFGRRLTQIYNGIKRNSNSSTRRSQKATRTLGVIMGCYILCWLPFFILAILKPITFNNGQSVGEFIPKWLDSFLLWLGYFNSALNPIIYARFNREFRLPFIEIMLFRCRGINRKLRDEDRKKMNFYDTNANGHNNVIAYSQNSLKKANNNITETDETNKNILKDEEASQITKDYLSPQDFENNDNNATYNLKDVNLFNKYEENIEKILNNCIKNLPINSKMSLELENVILICYKIRVGEGRNVHQIFFQFFFTIRLLCS